MSADNDTTSGEAQAGVEKPRNDVLDWLRKEGLPTEFRTANVFRKSHFRVFQGSHVADISEGKMREIDVLASMDIDFNERSFLRVSHLVECKWSGNKPWVVFTSPPGIAPAACVAQTYGSDLGSCLLWAMAADKALHRMELFATPEEPGYGGRQAHSGGNDPFYSAMRGVTSNGLSYLRGYDSRPRAKASMPPFGVIAFPTIVVEGQIFRAFFDERGQELKIEEVDHIRCHWRGAEGWPLHSSVDIVSVKSLDEFVRRRALESRTLLELMVPYAKMIAECCQTASLKPLSVSSTSRGMTALPKLLLEVEKKARTASKRTVRLGK